MNITPTNTQRHSEADYYDDPQIWEDEGWDTVITLFVQIPFGETLAYPVQDFAGGQAFIAFFGRDSYDRYMNTGTPRQYTRNQQVICTEGCGCRALFLDYVAGRARKECFILTETGLKLVVNVESLKAA